MEFKVLKKEEINELVSNEIIKLINEKESPILGLATGSTPLGIYANLVEAYKKGIVSFKNVRTFNLDEYVGLDGNHDQSYRYFMNHNLFDQIDIDKNNTRVPQGTGDYERSAEEYDSLIEKAGGIDIQILGIGSDGHIAFNEPGTSFESKTHVQDLEMQTIKDNSRFFASIDEVPKKAVTMGLKSIMNARRIILVALGKNKAEIIEKLVNSDVTESIPASILKKHNNVTIYCDQEAYSLVK